MEVEVHAMCWNEEQILPFFIKHYKTIADKIIIHDNYSTDKSRDIAEAAGCEVWLFGENGMNDLMHQEIKNTAWKGSRANWVIMVDMDEFLRVDRKTLDEDRYHMKTIYKVQGYNMYSEAMPRNSIWELNEGVPSDPALPDTNTKNVIFSPRALIDINYTPGCHRCDPRGEVVWADPILPLYHYHAIGGLSRFLERRYIRARRLSPVNLRLGHGVHYRYPQERQVALFREGMAARTPLFDPPKE